MWLLTFWITGEKSNSIHARGHMFRVHMQDVCGAHVNHPLPSPPRDMRRGVWLKFRVEREEKGEIMGAMEWNEETKRGIRKEPVNYHRGPEFLRVRHVTEETDSGKTAAVLWSAVRKWKERESEGRDGERGEEWETARGETGTNFYQISLRALCGGQRRKMNCSIWQLELPQRPEISSVEKNIMIPPGSTDSCPHRHMSTVYTAHEQGLRHTALNYFQTRCSSI